MYVCVPATEIGRVRKDMYNDSVNGGMFNGRDLEELPEAVGPVVQLQEKLYVPVKEYPDVSGRGATFHLSEGSLFTFSCCHSSSSIATNSPFYHVVFPPADVIRT